MASSSRVVKFDISMALLEAERDKTDAHKTKWKKTNADESEV